MRCKIKKMSWEIRNNDKSLSESRIADKKEVK